MLVDTKKSTDTFSFIILVRGGFNMGRPKGGKNKYWSKEEKLKYIQMVINDGISSYDIQKKYGIYHSTICRWIKSYNEYCMDGLENKRKPGNPLVKYSRRKELTELEKKDYEIMRLKIENERLKKGYTEADLILAKKKLLEKNSK